MKALLPLAVHWYRFDSLFVGNRNWGKREVSYELRPRYREAMLGLAYDLVRGSDGRMELEIDAGDYERVIEAMFGWCSLAVPSGAYDATNDWLNNFVSDDHAIEFSLTTHRQRIDVKPPFMLYRAGRRPLVVFENRQQMVRYQIEAT